MTETEVKEKRWYTVKVQNNRERSASEKLRFDMNLEFGEEVDIFIPTQTVSSVRGGKITQKEQLLYPGYIFVQTPDVDKVQHLAKSINGMNNILKDPQGNPIVMRQSEIDRMMGEKENHKVTKGIYMLNEEVNVINGPFASFKGTIKTIDYEKDKVKLEVVIFGRSTIVDLTVADITKI